MKSTRLNRIWLGVVLFALTVFAVGCTTSASSRYFGKTQPPSRNILRYISGSEPESLDPQIGTGQPEARVYMALYDGLVEYDPKTMQPIPAIAESWDISPNVDEFIFHLRKNAKWSDGTQITARDFVYTFRRGFQPELAARNANLGYYVKYAEAYNNKSFFVKKNGAFLLAKDFAKESAEQKPEQKTVEVPASFGAETEFRKYIKSPDSLIVKADEKERAKQLEANPKLKAAIEGAELVPVTAEDIGVEAVDDYTFRITLTQPAPFFLGLMAHQFFRLVPQHKIKEYGKAWTRPENIITCGAFKVKSYRPYDILVVERDPNYWDAATVKLDGIEFYPLEEQTTMLNLYKAGSVDALYNHMIPASWVDEIRQYKDEYLDHPEVANEYYSINTTKPPTDNLKVRQAFSMAIDRVGLAKLRKTTKPLNFFTPEGIFPEYEAARQRVGEEIRKERGISSEEWEARSKFNPEKARQLLTEAGYPVVRQGSGFACPSFPVDKVAISYNTREDNRQTAEFVQAQWKQNLGVTVPLKNMEWKTFLPLRSAVQYDGFARNGWVGDYMDPFTFLNLSYSPQNDGAHGWHDPKFDAMLDEANRTLDPTKRFELLARAEYYMLDHQIVIPLQTQATNWIKKPYVKGLYPNPGTLHAWKYVYIERDPAKWDTEVENIMK